VAAWLLCGGLFLLHSPARAAHKKGHKAQKGKRDTGPPLPPPRLSLRSFDLAAGEAHVEVIGARHAPESRFFVFTDERKRRFVPFLLSCQAAADQVADKPGAADGGGVKLAQAGPGPGASKQEAEPEPVAQSKTGHWNCSLGIPRIYQRAALVGLSLEIHGHVVSAPADLLQSAWAEARAKNPLPAAAEKPRAPTAPWGGSRRPPDGGVAPAADEVESEAEEQ
jgi:hypothetical protein